MVNTDNKIQINPGFASLILVACLFAGWQTLLIVAVLMFFFCDVDEKVKQVAISVITFYVGLTIVSWGFEILVSIANVFVDVINSLMAYLRTTFDADIDVAVLMTPIALVVKMAERVFAILITIAKLGFVVGILTGNSNKQNPLSGQINEYVNKALNYINGNIGANMNMNNQGMQAPMGAQMQGQQPMGMQGNMGMPQQNMNQQPNLGNMPQQPNR